MKNSTINQSLKKNESKPYSLSGQLLLWLMVCLFIILSISSVVSYSRAYQFANLAYDRSIYRAALALADQVDVVNNKVKVDLPQIAENLLEYDQHDYISYRISAPNGKFMAGDDELDLPAQKVLSGQHIYYDDMLNDDKVRVVAYALPIINSKLKGDLLIQVSETREKREIMVREIIEEMLVPQILIMLITALVIFFSVKHSLKPLNRLKNALASRSHSDLSAIPTNNTPLEITPLLDEINALMRRVEESVMFQKAFVADASHQLRTPLAILQNQAELALREDVSSHTQHALQNIATSTEHLSHLVHQLLTLARVEPSTHSNFTYAPVNLSHLAKEVTTDWVPQALEKGIDLGFDITESDVANIDATKSESTHMVMGNAFMLKEMLSNLIDNAIRYTPSHGEVTVSVKQHQLHVLLQVCDTGIGIPPEQRQQVFKRFYRIQNTVDGCGLGLAIVKEIANSHNAEVFITGNLEANTQTNDNQTANKTVGCIFNVQFQILHHVK